MELTTGNVQAPRSRLDDVDLFRGIGILLMIMGHIGFGSAFDKYIHAFHMPMFFFVSGYFYRPKKELGVMTLIGRKAKALLIPYVSFAAIHYVLYFMTGHLSDLGSLRSLLFNTAEPIPIAGALWFLTALFFTDVLYLLLDRLVRQKILLHILIAVLTLTGMLFGSVIPFRLPLAIDAAMVGLGFYHFARTARESRSLGEQLGLFRMKLWATLLLGAAVTVLIFLNGEVNMRAGRYAILPLSFVNAVLASVVGWNLCRYLHQGMERSAVLRRADGWMQRFGRDSIVALCLNQVTILAVNKGFALFIADAPWLHFVKLAVVLVILYLMILLVMGTKLRMLCGKTG